MTTANVVNTRVVPAATRDDPYYDDFDESKNFYGIKFRPGYPVQARELTQIHTILQNQIERFGRHIFVNGSSVIGGQIGTTAVSTLNLQSEYANTAVVVDDFIDKTIKFSSGNNSVIAKVIDGTAESDTDPATLYIQYITGDEFPIGSTIQANNENIYATIATTANATSNGMLAWINDSIYFFDGYFVKVPKQTVVINKYMLSNTSCKIGLELDSSVITELEDTSLLDPALESTNYQAPGATRYKMELVLARRDLDSIDDEQFIEITRIDNNIVKKNVTTPVYSEIEEVFARRTYDESGNYTVRPFVVTFVDDEIDPANNVLAVISPGKGYIYGYEFGTISDTQIQIPRARTIANVTNYNLICNYGNYVIVDNLRGTFDTSGMGVFDIHSVPYSYIDFTSNTTYMTTKVGTGRVKDIEFFSGDTDVTARKHEFYLFNTNFNTIVGNCSSTANSTSEAVLANNKFSANTNAYNGATIRILAGTSAGDVRTITAYNGTTKIATLNLPTTSALDTTSNVSIAFDFGEAESFVTHTSYTLGASANANTNITVLNKDNGLSNGRTYITDSAIRSLVFQFPDPYVAYGTISDMSYMYRRVFGSVQFTAGVSTSLVSGTDEGFEGATTSSNVAATATDNFLVITTNKQGSSRANGEQIKVRVDITGSPEQAVLTTDGGGSDTFLATVYAKMDVSSSAAQERVKTLVLANSQYYTSESSANNLINGTTNTSIYINTGQVVIQNPSRVPNEPMSLYLSDVIAIKAIYDLNGATLPAANAALSAYTDVTSRFGFVNGQRPEYYDHAYIYLKAGQVACKGPLVVCTRYYKSTTDTGYFSVDSYPYLTTDITEEGSSIGTGYAIIPSYDGDPLRDCIDFRPVRTNASNTEIKFTLNGIKLPIPAEDFNTDYGYYLPRRDLIVMTANRNERTITRVPGYPAKYPQYPLIPNRSMVLHSLYIPPYTDYPANVSVRYADTKRYTMKDIAQLDKRITNLEYYITLTELEKNALDLTIKDVDGFDRAKHGVFVDSFIGHSLADSANPDYKIAVDINGRFTNDGMAMPQYLIGSVKLDHDASGSTNTTECLDRILLDYTEEVAISQPVATKFTAVADYIFASFEGNIITTPEADNWKDTYNYDVVQTTNVANETSLAINVYVPYGSNFGVADAVAQAQRQLPSGYVVSSARLVGDQYVFDVSRV